MFPNYQDIQCIHGQPKRWELYGELDKKYSTNTSIAGIDLHYPNHWTNYLKYEETKLLILIFIRRVRWSGTVSIFLCMKKSAITRTNGSKRMY